MEILVLYAINTTEGQKPILQIGWEGHFWALKICFERGLSRALPVDFLLQSLFWPHKQKHRSRPRKPPLYFLFTFFLSFLGISFDRKVDGRATVRSNGDCFLIVRRGRCAARRLVFYLRTFGLTGCFRQPSLGVVAVLERATFFLEERK